MAQQRLGARVAAAEGAEDVRWGGASAEREHCVAEAAADFAHRLLVVEAGLLEGGESVGGEHLGPLVRVVARAVPAREDVAKRAEEAVVGQRRQDRVALGELVLELERRLLAARVVRVVEAHVERSKHELADHAHARLERPLLTELAEEIPRQRLARFIVLRHARIVHGRRIIAPVLHELRRQLDGVPLDAGDAGRRRVRHLGQHVLQPVTRLVEERRDFVEGHERRLAVHRRRAVARQVRHRLAVEHLGPADTDAHPRAAALVLWPRVRVEEEGREVLTARLVEHLEEADIRVPHLRLAVGADNLDAVQPPAEPEQAVEDVVQRKVRPQLLLLEAKGVLREALRPEGDVPQRERRAVEAVCGCKLGQLLQLLLRGGEGLGEKHLCEVVDGLDRRRHLALDAHLGVAAEAEDGRLLLLDLQNLPDERRVHLARAGHKGAVQRLAHRPVAQELHRRQVGRHVEPEPPRPALRRRALLPLLRRARCGERERRRRQPVHLRRLGEGEGEGLGRVEQVVGEGGGELGEPDAVGVEALLLLALQADAREAHRRQRALHDPLLRRLERAVLLERLERLEDRL
mmetsp:Transcript_14116/g.41426  ORF Transcript_14116/g.41426 Transcript_14116/m.41426 type:complete len:576 (-) Transcript_14116:454-2181(-)